MPNTDFLYHYEVFRIYSIVEVNENGMYGEDQTPEDENTGIKIEVVHAVGFITTAGDFNCQLFYNPIPLDKKRVKMGDYELEGHFWLDSDIDSGDTKIKVYNREPANIPDAVWDTWQQRKRAFGEHSFADTNNNDNVAAVEPSDRIYYPYVN